jgi:ACT domain-containing protein
MKGFTEGDTIDNAIRILVTQPITRDDRLRVLNRIWQVDMRSTSYKMLENVPQINDDNIYRVSVCPDGVDVVCFGMGVDTIHDGHYINVDVLPKWVQERLAVLMMMTHTPPTEEVEGVGRRISRDVYWVYKPDGVM